MDIELYTKVYLGVLYFAFIGIQTTIKSQACSAWAVNIRTRTSQLGSSKLKLWKLFKEEVSLMCSCVVKEELKYFLNCEVCICNWINP